MKRFTKDKLKNVRPRPQGAAIVYVPYTVKDRAEVLHITKNVGDYPYRALATRTGMRTHDITECGRVFEWDQIYCDGVLPENNFSYRFCQRCGSEEDFGVALSEYWDWRKKRDREWAEEKAEKQREYEEGQLRKSKAIFDLWEQITLGQIERDMVKCEPSALYITDLYGNKFKVTLDGLAQADD